MKARFLLAAAAFAVAVFTAEAFDSYKDAFQAARKARNEKNYDEALKILEEAKSLAKNPWQKYQSLDFAAEVFWNKKDLDGALSKLDEIIANEETKADWKANALTKRANFMKWKGKGAEAEEFYKKAMELDATGGAKQNVLISYADLLRAQKKFDEAMKLLQDALAVENGAAYQISSAKLGMASVEADRKEYDKASALYNELFNVKETWIADAARIQMVEKVYLFQNKFAEAAQFLDKVEADESIAKNRKGWIPDARVRIIIFEASPLIREKKFEEAAEKLKAADAFPNISGGMKNWLASTKAACHSARANAFKREKKYDEALEEFKKILDVKDIPNYSLYDAYLNIADVLINQKKFDEAKEYIDKSIALPKQSGNMKIRNQHALASYYLAKQEVDEAVAALEKAVSIEGKVDASLKAFAYNRLADIYFGRKKDVAKADEYMKKAQAVPNVKWGINKGLADRIQKALEKQNQ